jgi:hypothetical protein
VNTWELSHHLPTLSLENPNLSLDLPPFFLSMRISEIVPRFFDTGSNHLVLSHHLCVTRSSELIPTIPTYIDLHVVGTYVHTYTHIQDLPSLL